MRMLSRGLLVLAFVTLVGSFVRAGQEPGAPPRVSPRTGGEDAPRAPVVVQPSVNLNTATLAQLDALPGIGRTTAARIIEYRQKNGGFKKIEELMNVKGIGEKVFLRLKPMVFVPKPTDRPIGQ